MILCSIHDFRRFCGLNPHFDRLADLLEQHPLKALAKGRHEFVADRLFAIASPLAETRSSAMLEVHRRYIDVHVTFEGVDNIGWTPLSGLTMADAPFNVESDFQCFRDEYTSIFPVAAGQLMVCFPEDAHAPLLGKGELVHKCVLKIAVDGAS